MSIALVAQDILNHRGRKRESERKDRTQTVVVACSSAVAWTQFIITVDSVHGVVVLLGLLPAFCYAHASAGGLLGWWASLPVVLQPQGSQTKFFQSIMISGLWEDENEAFLEIAGYHFHENHRAGPDSRCGEIDSPSWWKNQQAF